MIAGELILACMLDVVLGDPRWLPHPVRLMGRVITWYDGCVRRAAHGPSGEQAAGIALALGLPAFTYAAGWLAIELAGRAHVMLGAVVWVVLAWTTIAARDLSDHALAVQLALEQGALARARQALAQIVGRDTDQLSEPEVVRATVETLAESASDGVIAPLFFLSLGGPPAALAYKAINTLDSLVGHLDPKYRHLGWASARLDDAANWIPARLTALLLVVAAGLTTRRVAPMRRAWRVLRRDGHKHPSPNSGRPEAAMAGALGVQLGGRNVYDGVPEDRPLLGDAGEPLARAHLHRALTLMWLASGLGILLAVSWLAR